MTRACLVGAWLSLAACESGTTFDDAGLVRDAGTAACLRLPELIEFGEVTNATRTEQVVVLTSPRTLTRDSFRVSQLDPPFALNVLQLGANQLSFRFAFVPTDSRLQFGELIFVGGPGCAPQTVRLSGLGTGGVQVDPVLDFGSVALHTPTQRPLVVRNSRRTAVNITAAIGGPFIIDSSLHLEAGASGSLMVTGNLAFRGPLSSMASVESTSGERFLVEIRANGGVAKAVLSPESLDFGHLPTLSSLIGGTQRRVQLQNLGDGPLQVSVAGVTPADGVSVRAPPAIPPLSSAELVVQLNVANAGARTWTLRLTTNDPDRPMIDFSITALAENIAACPLRVEPRVNPIEVTAPYPQSVTLQFDNPNAGTCLLDDVELSQGVWSATLPPQIFIDGGATLDVPIAALGSGFGTLSFSTVGAPNGTSVSLVAQ
ncbi:MAG: hypothetical protein QM817_07850 [Archangium sp.]